MINSAADHSSSRRFYLAFLLLILLFLISYVILRIYIETDNYQQEQLQAQQEAYEIALPE